MRKLALDVGQKRIGIAVSDETNILASPVTTILRSSLETESKEINAIADEYEVDEIIAGLPIDLRGETGIAAQKMEIYLTELQKHLKVSIVKFDERLTTKIASAELVKLGVKSKKRKKIIDEMAAAVLLQNYLDHLDKNSHDF